MAGSFALATASVFAQYAFVATGVDSVWFVAPLAHALYCLVLSDWGTPWVCPQCERATVGRACSACNRERSGDRIRQPTLPLHVIVLPIGAVIATYPVVLVATAVVPASTLFGFTGPLFFFLLTGIMAAGAAMLALGVRAMAFATWELLQSNG